MTCDAVRESTFPRICKVRCLRATSIRTITKTTTFPSNTSPTTSRAKPTIPPVPIKPSRPQQSIGKRSKRNKEKAPLATYHKAGSPKAPFLKMRYGVTGVSVMPFSLFYFLLALVTPKDCLASHRRWYQNYHSFP